MILDDHEHPDPDDHHGELLVEEENLDDDHVDGLRRAGLPVRSGAIVGERGPSAQLDGLMSAAWAGPGASSRLVQLVSSSLAESTREAYQQDWGDFAAWAHGLRGLDDPTAADELDVAEYVAHLVGARLTVATIRRRLAAIGFAMELVGRPPPLKSRAVWRALQGAKATLGTTQDRAEPLRLDDMRRLVVRLPITHSQRHSMRRDQLLVALGWAGALRPSDLVGLNVEDLHFVGDPEAGDGGVALKIGRSKTHRTEVRWVAIPYASQTSWCPVRIALRWTRQHRTGPLFRSIDRHGRVGGRLGANAISRILKPLAGELLQTDGLVYRGGSLRAGWITEARAHGIADELIRNHTRHAQPTSRHNIVDVYDHRDLFEPSRSPFAGWW